MMEGDAPIWPEILSDRFTPEACIGAGSMGAVWRARQCTDGALCAVKVTHPRLARQPDVQRRFIREAAAVFRLRHPHIVQLRDFLQAEDGTLALVMEHVEGASMAQQRATALPWPVLRRLLLQVLDALAFAHGLGVTHRDLKPENVLIGRDALGDPMAQLVDFGIARFNGLEEGELGSGVTGFNQLGSPPYAAPEQLVASQYVTSLADIFSFGVLAWEFVAGQLPWDADRRQRMELQKLEGTVPPLVQRRGVDAPAGLEAILRRCLQPVPLTRYWFAAELRKAIETLPEDSEVLLPSSSRAGSSPVPEEDTQPIPEPQLRVQAGDATALHAGGLLIGPDARRFVQEPAFVGREDVRALLRGRVEEVLSDNEAAGVWIQGPTGSGKTRVMRWLRSALTADAAMTVVHLHMDARGLGSALRRSVLELFCCDPALQSGRNWMRETLRCLGLEGAARDRIVRLLEETDPAGSADDWYAWGILAETIARRHPLCILVDSIRSDHIHEVAQLFEWSLRSLGRRRAPLLVVCAVTAPPDAAPPEWPALVADGFRAPSAIRLHGMSGAELEEMLRSMDCAPARRRAIMGLAGGSPMLATEVLHRGDDAPPLAEGLAAECLARTLLLERLAACRHPSLRGEDLFDLLQGLAPGPAHVSRTTLEAVFGVSAPEIPRRRLHLMLHTLCELRVLVASAVGDTFSFSFRHELWRQVALRELRACGGVERWGRGWVRAFPSALPSAAELEQRARIHDLCGQGESALHARIDATERALERGELRRAFGLSRAVEESLRDSVQRDPSRRQVWLQSGLQRVRILDRCGQLREAVALSGRLLRAGRTGGGEWALLLRARHARLLLQSGHEEEVDVLLAHPIPKHAAPSASVALAEFACVRAERCLTRREDAQCRVEIERGLDLLGLQVDSLHRVELHLYFARLLFALGETERAFHICEQVHSWAIAEDVRCAVPLLSLVLGINDLAVGNLTEARRRALRALRYFGVSGDRKYEAGAEILLAGVEFRQGDVERAAGRVRRIRKTGTELDVLALDLLTLIEEGTRSAKQAGVPSASPSRDILRLREPLLGPPPPLASGDAALLH